ncbi:Tripartite ATP-independent periplasmic transporter DctQ component [Rhizobium sp. CF080]|uniref:TRAP transporter small permease n=1 Tax=Rhizobium sp. (strain CF080) TaxID=1144310 RepID=UPI000271AB7C|nr:TRAP transporter small permease [Rhizobium sp. CF080]EUB98777.1 Tripartite ATP-independent periplasmic transporter DctQ component [Rhizobium sp. CF080]
MISRILFGTLEKLLIAALALMVILIFGNVVLRYGFNSGITLSEELSRFIFVWLIFIGAFLTLRDRAHLGVNSLVRAMPFKAQRAVRIGGDIATLICCYLLGLGAWRQVLDNLENYSPVAGIPLGWVYFSCVLCCIGMAVLQLRSIFDVATGRIPDEEIFASNADGLVE